MPTRPDDGVVELAEMGNLARVDLSWGTPRTRDNAVPARFFPLPMTAHTPVSSMLALALRSLFFFVTWSACTSCSSLPFSTSTRRTARRRGCSIQQLLLRRDVGSIEGPAPSLRPLGTDTSRLWHVLVHFRPRTHPGPSRIVLATGWLPRCPYCSDVRTSNVRYHSRTLNVGLASSVLCVFNRSWNMPNSSREVTAVRERCPGCHPSAARNDELDCAYLATGFCLKLGMISASSGIYLVVRRR